MPKTSKAAKFSARRSGDSSARYLRTAGVNNAPATPIRRTETTTETGSLSTPSIPKATTRRPHPATIEGQGPTRSTSAPLGRKSPCWLRVRAPSTMPTVAAAMPSPSVR